MSQLCLVTNFTKYETLTGVCLNKIKLSLFEFCLTQWWTLLYLTCTYIIYIHWASANQLILIYLPFIKSTINCYRLTLLRQYKNTSIVCSPLLAQQCTSKRHIKPTRTAYRNYLPISNVFCYVYILLSAMQPYIYIIPEKEQTALCVFLNSYE